MLRSPPPAVRVLAALLVLGAVITLVALTRGSRTPLDRLPLAHVPEAELTRQDFGIDPAYGEAAAVPPQAADSIAHDIVCCGEIQQTVLVWLSHRGNPTQRWLAYAVNFDTVTGFDTPAVGGFFRTGFTNKMPYFVLFLDAQTAKHLYQLAPSSEYPWPKATATEVVLDRIPVNSLHAAGVTVERPRGDQTAVYAPSRIDLYNRAAADAGELDEFVLARVKLSPADVPVLQWLAVPNEGVGRYILVFINPDDGNAWRQMEVSRIA